MHEMRSAQAFAPRLAMSTRRAQEAVASLCGPQMSPHDKIAERRRRTVFRTAASSTVAWPSITATSRHASAA